MTFTLLPQSFPDTLTYQWEASNTNTANLESKTRSSVFKTMLTLFCPDHSSSSLRTLHMYMPSFGEADYEPCYACPGPTVHTRSGQPIPAISLSTELPELAAILPADTEQRHDPAKPSEPASDAAESLKAAHAKQKSHRDQPSDAALPLIGSSDLQARAAAAADRLPLGASYNTETPAESEDIELVISEDDAQPSEVQQDADLPKGAYHSLHIFLLPSHERLCKCLCCSPKPCLLHAFQCLSSMLQGDNYD